MSCAVTSHVGDVARSWTPDLVRSVAVGELLAVGSAVAWALTSVAMRPIAGRALWFSSVLRTLLCSVTLALYGWFSGALTTVLHTDPRALALLLRSTLCSIVVGDSLSFLPAARLGA